MKKTVAVVSIWGRRWLLAVDGEDHDEIVLRDPRTGVMRHVHGNEPWGRATRATSDADNWGVVVDPISHALVFQHVRTGQVRVFTSFAEIAQRRRVRKWVAA